MSLPEQLTNAAPYGYDIYTHTEVTPKSPPTTVNWRVAVKAKPANYEPNISFRHTPFVQSEVTVQLTADQQVELSISGEDKYGNQVDISGDVAWLSSDESIIQVESGTETNQATAVAVGPEGTASVTVTNDVDQDGSGDFQGSIAIDVVAGDVAEIAITAAAPTDKPATA